MKDKATEECGLKIRLICGTCGTESRWPVEVCAGPNMPTCCGKELWILGNDTDLHVPYSEPKH
jgi:hypothetical protein